MKKEPQPFCGITQPKHKLGAQNENLWKDLQQTTGGPMELF